MRAKVIGTGSCLPDRCVTNEYLSTIMDTSDEWITSRTGIRNRHHCSGQETFSAITAAAAREALAAAGVRPEEIGACIVATVTADTLVPSAACVLQRALGLPEDIPCFDLNAACTGFLFALHTMECLRNASPRKFGLVVGAEGSGVSRLVKESCDITVALPLRGKIGSLNASVAAGIVMYEMARQRMGLKAK